MTTEEIKLDADLYEQVAVEEAALAFESLAEIRVERRGPHIVAIVENAREDLAARLSDEFCDHALFRTIQHAQKAWK